MTVHIPNARFAYDQFRLSQPQIVELGLWHDSTTFYIVCPDLSEHLLTKEGKVLQDWFPQSLKPMGLPLSLISEIPPNSTKLEDRDLDEIIFLHGSTKTRNELIYDLESELPFGFPDFRIMEPGGNRVDLITESELSTEERIQFDLIKKRMGFHFHMDTISQPHLFKEKLNFKVGFPDQKLLPKRYLSKLNVSSDLHKLWSEDQDLWQQNRLDLIKSQSVANSFLPVKWNEEKYKCLLQTSSSPTEDFRNFLSLYDTVVAEMPLSGHQDNFLHSAKVSEAEILKLVEMERVRFVMPYSIERYSLSLVEKISEVNPDAILFPRRLCCESILNLKKVAPFLMPPISTHEKKIFLSAIMTLLKDTKNPILGKFLKFLVEELSRIWMQLEYRLNSQGPSSSSSVGLGFLADSIIKEHTGRDLSVELITTAPSIEWASAINASIAPVEGPNYSNEALCRILISLYHGIEAGPPTVDDKTKLIASQILSIGSKVSIVDFADQVRNGDLARFRRLVLDVASADGTPEQLGEAIKSLNAEVRRYEKKEDFLNKFDLVGLAFGFAKKPPGFSWLSDLISPAIEKQKTDRAILGGILDTLQGMKTLDPPHRPFIARLKKNLRGKIE